MKNPTKHLDRGALTTVILGGYKLSIGERLGLKLKPVRELEDEKMCQSVKVRCIGHTLQDPCI